MAGSPNRGVIVNVNSRNAKVPTEKELGFDPNGPGWFITGVRDPIGAIFAASADKAAREVAGKLYPPGTDRGAANAFQHGAGSYLLARTIGEKRAKQWGDAHEVDGIDPTLIDRTLKIARKNNESERAMDLYNNRVGRGLPAGGASHVQEALKNGHFRKKPF
jgi:hypothetical protein